MEIKYFFISFVIFLGIFILTVLADTTSDYLNMCKSNSEFLKNICKNENCLALKFSIINGKQVEQNIVGDYFYYNVTITNFAGTINLSKLTIKVIDPQNSVLIPIRGYDVNLQSNHSLSIFPNLSFNNVNIYPLDLVGSYKLSISSSQQILLFSFYENCRYINYENSINYTFDTIPSWQYESNQLTKNQTNQLINLNLKLLILSIVLAYTALITLVSEIFKTKDIIHRVILIIGFIIVVILFKYFFQIS